MLKRFCHYVCFIAVLPLILLSQRKMAGVGAFFFNLCATTLALVPGKVGSYLRVAYYKGVVDHFDWNVNIGFGSFFSKQTVGIGEHVSIGAYCIIGSVEIGRNCHIASRVSIPSGRRQHADSPRGSRAAEPFFSTITIGAHSWIGEGAIILDDVGADCVVGAGSVVVNRVKDGETVAGNPARVIKGRQGT
jgi:acetyltransferase-like isoleucine patch superfamily enzyme